MTAGDIGVGIVCNSGGYSMLGATVTLLAAPGRIGRTGAALSLSPVVVSGGGLIATYLTTGTDFTQGGPWQLQLEVVTPTQTYTSPPAEIFVYPRL